MMKLEVTFAKLQDYKITRLLLYTLIQSIPGYSHTRIVPAC